MNLLFYNISSHAKENSGIDKMPLLQNKSFNNIHTSWSILYLAVH